MGDSNQIRYCQARRMIRSLVIFLKDWVNRNPSLKGGVLRLLSPFPRLKERLKRVGKSQEFAIAEGQVAIVCDFPPIPSQDLHFNAWINSNEKVFVEQGWLQSYADCRVSVLLTVDELSFTRVKDTRDSLLQQLFINWELIVAPVVPSDEQDSPIFSVESLPGEADARVVLLQTMPSRGGALRLAVEAATGDFILTLQAGDILPPYAFSVLVNRMASNPIIDILYADEDVVEDGFRRSPQLKPEWSPELLRSYNYFGRPAVVRKTALLSAGSFAVDLGEASEWDLFLRMTEPFMDRVSTPHIQREARILCHRHPQSNNGRAPANEMGIKDFKMCLRQHWNRQGLAAKVTVQSDGTLHAEWEILNPPLVSVIIPNKNHAELLRVCLNGLWHCTSYSNIEIIVVDNGSTEPDVLELYDKAAAAGVKIVDFAEPFNYSRACNRGAESAKGDILLFLNNDVEMPNPGWLSELVRQAQLPGVGVIGTKLVYPDGTLQHAGVVVGMHVCGMVFHSGREHEWGPFGSPSVTRNWLGIMGACQMVRREVFDRIGGFDETYVIAMSDIKLCIDAWRAGYRTVYAPQAMLIHHEGASRGKSNPAKDIQRTIHDIQACGFEEDPYFHPGLSAIRPVPTLRIGAEPSNRTSLLIDTERLIGPIKLSTEPDLSDDSAVALAAGRKRGSVLWEPDPAGKIDSTLAAARFVIDLLRRRPDLRKRFPRALSDGVKGEFMRWLSAEGLVNFGFAAESAAHIIAAYAAELSVRARQVTLFEYSLRAAEPLLLLPSGRSKMIKILFDAVALGLLSKEAAWWGLMELAEQPSYAIVWTWQHTPVWQEKFPNGITRFGRESFSAWLVKTYSLHATWLDASKWPELVNEADQIRIAYNADASLRERFPQAMSDQNECLAMLEFLGSSQSQLTVDVQTWLSSLDKEETAKRLLRCGVNIFGHFSYPSGLRTSVEAVVEGLRTANFDFSKRNVPVSLATDKTEGSMYAEPELFDVSLIHVQPEPFFEQVRQRANLAERVLRPYQIGYWYWEFDSIPSSWDSSAKQCDELWTATQFIAEGLRSRYNKPVHVFLPGVELPEFSHLPRSHYDLPDNAFIFLFTFHMTSIMERKNPLGLIRAFKKAFGPADHQAMLVIKTSFGNRHPSELQKLITEADDANIRIIDEVYTMEENLNLMRVSDAYVSLHRSEGLGLTMAEAMLLGRPTIATRFSGNLEFMDNNNSLLVDFELKVLEKDYPPYSAGLKWAEPSVEHAAQLMRRLYCDREFSRVLGLQAQADLRRRLNYVETGKPMAARLVEIEQKR